MSDKLPLFNSRFLILNRPFDVQVLFTAENKICPWFGLATSRRVALSNGLREDFHPTVLLCPAVGVEVNNLSVAEANSETFFDKHIALFLLGKGRFTSSTTLSRCLFLSER